MSEDSRPPDERRSSRDQDTRGSDECSGTEAGGETTELAENAGLFRPGQVVGERYEIVELLGRGGMGLVWRAHDTTLERDVALKVLPEEFAGDEERFARFQREAKIVAGLDHPNIVTVYSVEEADGRHFITMQLVEGQTLREVIPEGGLSLKSFFKLAIPLTEAVQAAHQREIVHRDLKPGNIMVSPDGRLRVLDFGLAKLHDAPGSEFEATATIAPGTDPTFVTHVGKLLGTVSYMSPEQAEGKPVDHRSDLFSLGVVLYEMATGNRPFRGDSNISVLASIVRDSPPMVTEVNPELPPPLGDTIQTALAKDPVQRFQSARELADELRAMWDQLRSGTSAPSQSIQQPRPRASKSSKASWIIGGAALILAVAAGLFVLLQPKGSAEPPKHRQVTFTGDATHPALSPDGAFAAYATGGDPDRRAVMVHDLAGDQALEVFEGEQCEALRWSPDGSRLLFSCIGEEVSTHMVSRLGGPARTLPEFPQVAWSPDGNRYAGAFTNGKTVNIVEIETESVRSIPLTGPFTWLLDLDWSPAGDRLAVLVADAGEDVFSIWSVAVDDDQQEEIVREEVPVASARWSPDADAIFYLRDGAEVWRAPLSRTTGLAAGEPRAVLTGMESGEVFSLSGAGDRLLHTRVSSSSNLWLTAGGGVGGGRPTPLTTGTLEHSHPSLSPDGRTVVFTRGDGTNSNIFTMPIEGGTPEQLTFFEASRAESPVWSPDGTRIAFGATEGGTARIWLIDASGGAPRQLEHTELPADWMSLSWAPGNEIIYQLPDGRNFRVLDPSTGEQRLLLDDSFPGWVFSVRMSPDGSRYLAFFNWRGSLGIRVVSLDTNLRHRWLAGGIDTQMYQSLDAAELRGREFRLSAGVRVSGAGPDDGVSLWLETEVQDNAMGSFAAMEGEDLITDPEWRRYSVSGTVDPEALEVHLGVGFFGAGTAWVDEVVLETRDADGEWRNVDIANPGFELKREDGSPVGWTYAEGAHAFDLIADGAAEGDLSLRVSDLDIEKTVFDLPIGWSADGRFVYALRTQTGRLFRLPADGGPAEAVDTLAGPGQSVSSASLGSDGALVYALKEVQSDVWLVENFGP